MRYVSQVETNAKLGAACKLGPKTLIYGPNESGKSTILHAITLGLYGAAYDVAGQDLCTADAELHRLLRGDDNNLEAYVDVKGEDAAWSFSYEKGPGSSADRVTPLKLDFPSSYPVPFLRAKMGGAAKTRRAWLASLAGQGVTRKMIAEIVGRYITGEEIPEGDREWVDWLTAQEKDADSRARKGATAVRLLEEQVAQTRARAGLSVPDEELERARTAYEAASKALTPDEFRVKQASLQQWRDYKTAQEEQKVKAETAIAQCEEYIANNPPPAKSVKGEYLKQRRIMVATWKAWYGKSPGEASCMLCGEATPPDPDNILPQIDAELSKLPQDTTGPWKEALDKWQGVLRSAFAEITKADNAISTLEAEVNAATVQQDKTALREAYEALVTRRAQHDELKRTVAQFDEAKFEREKQVARRKAYQKARTDVIALTKDAFPAKVEAFLREGVKVGIENDTHPSIGLVQDGVLVNALSGATEAEFLCALAATMAEDGGLTVIVPDERAWDMGRLEATMRALTDAPAQVVLTSIEKPEVELDGWTYVSAEEARAAYARLLGQA